MKQDSVCVLGAGSWGTALAMVLARQDRPTTLIARNPETAALMQQSRENKRYLTNIRFPDSLTVSCNHPPALEQASAIVLALPCSAILEILPALSGLNKPIIAACKGLNPQTLERMDETLLHHIGSEYAALLSGPSFAIEVAQGMPTAILATNQQI